MFVSVTTGPTCSWTATANAPWLSVTVATGTGNGTATVTAAANSGGDRSGTVTIAGQTFTVTQPAAPPACTYSIAPTSQAFTSDGGTVSVTVTTGNTCTWNAMSNAPWISVQPAGQQTGPGSVTVTVAPNGGGDRNATATIAGQVFSVTQTAAPPPCTYSLSPTNQAFTSDGGSGTITVTTGSGCAWTATTDRDWITFTSAASGVGPGTVTFQVGVNTGGNRDGNIKVATENFKVTQSEPPKGMTAATAR
jgi:hypothetical protein